MDLAERIAALSTKLDQQRAGIETEEATKNAFVMPFLSSILGYDVFDPTEVVPEYVADVGIKKGEKIDYAIMQAGQVLMLVECKKIGAPLKVEHASQLYRYFGVTSARIALLTNGQVYEFYTDLDAPNRMDEKPFLVLDVQDVDRMILPELEKMTKSSFDLESIISAAGELKYISQLKRAIAAQFKEPEVEFVRFFTGKVYEKSFSLKVREQFTPLVQKACRQFLNDQVNDRLTAALGVGGASPAPVAAPAATLTSQAADFETETTDANGDEVITTMDEIEGFQIVRAIVCDVIKPQRIVYRDAKSYCAILVDDNNRRTLARLHFNRKQRYIGLFGEDKTEARHPLEGLEDIYNFSRELREAAGRYA